MSCVQQFNTLIRKCFYMSFFALGGIFSLLQRVTIPDSPLGIHMKITRRSADLQRVWFLSLDLLMVIQSRKSEKGTAVVLVL